MEKSTSQGNSTPPVKAVKQSSYFIPVAIVIGFLAAAITYRIITLNDLDESQNLLLRYEEIAKGRDAAGLMEDRSILNRIVVQSLQDAGRVPSREEIATKAEALAEAADLAGEMQAQRGRFTFFLDVVIYGLAGVLILFLAAYIRRQRIIHPR